MYNQTAQHQSYRRDSRTAPGRYGRRRDDGTRRQERTRLIQLLVCLALFLAAFLGKGAFPRRLEEARSSLLSLLTADTDFRAAFSRIGESLAGEDALLGTLGDFCVEVFGPSQSQPVEQSVTPQPQFTSLLTAERAFLSGEPDIQDRSDHYLEGAVERSGLRISAGTANEAQAEPEPQPEEEPAVAAVGAVLLKSDYSGMALPEGYTMDQLSLGGLETVTPVLGHINSTYGYRDHPISGKYLFHGGVDIGGQTGDPIRAFAAGTVEYVGENDSYGLYIQLDHGNGIKSFYAHCRSLCVKKGQSVALGEKIGEVGSSGAATGPHLHLELKCAGLHLDPLYYIDSLSNQ